METDQEPDSNLQQQQPPPAPPAPPPDDDTASKAAVLGLLLFWSASKRAYYSRSRPGARLKRIPEDTIRRVLQQAADSSKTALARLTQELVDNKITIAEWAVAVRDEIRNGHRVAALLANGNALDARAAGQLGAAVRRQYQYFEAFVRQIEDGTAPLGPRSVARARLYGQAIMTMYERAVVAREAAAGRTRYKLVLAPAEHCDQCVEDAAKGFVPIGTLKAIGERTCLVNCRCHWEYAR